MKVSYAEVMNFWKKTKENGDMKTMKRFIAALCTAASVFIGCQEEQSDNHIVTENYHATIETFNTDTKTNIGEGNKVIWSEGDEIAIFEGNDKGNAYHILDSYVGKSSGEFSPTEGLTTKGGTGEQFSNTIAVYPFNPDLAVTYYEGSYGITRITFPEVQKYTSGSFADEAFPMAAITKNGDKSLNFKNVGGVVKLSLTGSYAIQEITLTGNSGELLSGIAKVTINQDGIRKVTMNVHASQSVTVICEPAVQLDSESATDFYISIPPTEFKAGFTVTVTDSEGNKIYKSTSKKQSVARSHILSMPEFEFDKIFSSEATENYIDLNIGKGADIVSYDENSGQLVLDYSQSAIPDIRNGKAFVMPETYDHDIRVITGHKTTGNTVNLETTQGNMSNLFKNTGFTLVTSTSPVTRSSVNTNVITPSAYGYIDSKGNYHEIYNIDTRSEEYGTNMKFWSFDKDFNNETILEGKAGRLYWEKCTFSAGLNGEFTFDFGEKKIDEVTSIGELNHFKYVLTGSVDIDLLLHYEYLAKHTENDDEIIKKNIIPALRFTFVVSGVPVHLQVETHIGKYTEFVAEGKIDASAGVKLGSSVEFGAEWDKTNGFSAISDVTPYFTVHQPKFDVEASASAKVSYYPHLDIKLYKFLGPWIEPRPYIKGNVGAGLHMSTEGENVAGWYSTTFAGMNLKMGLLLDFGIWDKDLWTSGTYSPIKDKLLFQAPSRITKVSPEDMTLVPDGESIETEFLVESYCPLTESYYPCPLALVNFKTDYGEVTPTLAVADLDGKVSATWTPADNLDNTQETTVKDLTASIVAQSGETINSATLKIETEKDDIREMLIKLYNDTDGDNWTNNENWCSDKPIEEWYGIEVRSDQKIAITLDDNSLTGSIDMANCSFLYSLSCNYNSLKSIDVSGCTNLDELCCYRNQLTELSVYGCSYLWTIQAWNNELSSIALTGLTRLANLSIEANQIKKMDVSNCTNLSTLYCSSNQLTELDLAENKRLCMISCDYNQLKTLDLSNQVGWSGINCSDNQLTSLILPENSTSLSEISLNCGNNQLTFIDIDDFTNLNYLNCDNNQLTSLDLPKQSMLYTISCNGNKLTSLNVSSCPELRFINCGDNKISEFKFPEKNILRYLNCENNELTSLTLEGFPELEDLRCQGNPLKTIEISNCGFHAIIDDTIGDDSLVSLYISDCPKLKLIDFIDVEVNELFIRDCPIINSIDCHWVELSTLNISNCESLTEIDCGFNQLTSLGVDIDSCKNLRKLSCAGNYINSEIPSSFKQLEYFDYDQKYENYWWSTNDGRYIYHMNDYGWWYPGEPEKGYHGW